MHDYELVILSVYQFELRAAQSFQAQSNSGIAVKDPIFPMYAFCYCFIVILDLIYPAIRVWMSYYFLECENDSHEPRVKRHFSRHSDEFLNLQECHKIDSLSWSEGSKTFSWWPYSVTKSTAKFRRAFFVVIRCVSFFGFHKAVWNYSSH